ncbi:hypothetical protein HMPREF2690_00020 [Corynebacterium sp. HMSC034E11]|uniref:glycosyltransferase family 2 protein n=1 Tax=Corynebacterium sp. HMSC034E11 TaxID=1715169 RepID=UPI0008A940F9|nr:glycosyltransferase family 2 protein [Corynebacterium sp. HMSC034E11]OHO35759.1 hypothetical protein HMPREF2690_00020 [Corynebacterium sp. HMSC034E11]
MKKYPTLAVIVPAFNVEQYLAECVQSILESDYPSLEVVVVNDGSTDGTPKIAEMLSAAHENVRVIHQENAGLSAARNTGIDNTSSELLAFVDSDDLVPPHAYTKMADTMAKSNSGMVVGAVERFNSSRRWQPWFVEEAHRVEQIGISATQFPAILWNVFAWSKLFKRDYFDQIAGRFPVGMLYEDQEISARMYLSGVPFDIVPDVVYYWRAREDGTSITQNKTSLDDLTQRLEVARSTEEVILDSQNQDVIEYWYRKLLNEDLWWYFRVVPNTSSLYWQTLREYVLDFVSRAPSSSVMLGPTKRKDLIALLLRDKRSAFEKRLKRP